MTATQLALALAYGPLHIPMGAAVKVQPARGSAWDDGQVVGWNDDETVKNYRVQWGRYVCVGWPERVRCVALTFNGG